MCSEYEVTRERDLERELVENYPDLALLLRRTAQMHAWQPSEVGDRVLRRLAEAVATVLEQRLPPAAADALVAAAVAETQAWLATGRDEHGRAGTRTGHGR